MHRRPRSRRRSLPIVAAALGLGVALGGRELLAQSRADVRVVYVANAPRCPPAEAFTDAFTRRSPNVHVAQSGDAQRRLDVRLDPHEGRVVGRLTLVERGHDDTVREVTGTSCAEVVASLAFVAAVAIEDRLTNATPPPSGDATDAGTARAEPADANVDASASANAPPSAPSATASAPPALAPATTRAFHVAAGVHAQAFAPPAPAVLFALPVFAEGSLESDAFVASTRLRFVRAGGTSSVPDVGSAHLTWTLGALDACAGAYGSERRVRGDACVRAQAGVLRAVGSDVTPARSASRPWFDLGAAARARWIVLGDAFVEAEASLSFPFVRDRFEVTPNRLIYRVSAVGLGAAAGAGVALW